MRNSKDSRGRLCRELGEHSEEIGLSSKQGIGAFGPYTIILYGEKAQRFILDNIHEIVELGKENK